MIRYDELLFKRFNEDWSKLPVSKMLSLLNVKKQTTLPTVVNSDLLNKKLNIKFGIDVPVVIFAGYSLYWYDYFLFTRRML